MERKERKEGKGRIKEGRPVFSVQFVSNPTTTNTTGSEIAKFRQCWYVSTPFLDRDVEIEIT